MLKRWFARILCAGVLLAACGLAQAEQVAVVSRLNLVSDKSQDISTLEAWKNTWIKDGMSEQDKAIAIFNTIVRYRHQANPPREYHSSEMAGGHVHDPLKNFHVYGYNQCCCTAAQVQAFARYLGLPARGRPITVHSVAEVLCDGGWRLVDPSVMNYHVKDDGTLASVDEIHQAVDQWLKANPEFAEGEIKDRDTALRKFAKNQGWKNGPPLLARSDKFYGEHGVNTAGWHGWSSTMIEYSKVLEPDEFYATMGYQLNVQLRPGEKITRNFFSRGIEYTNKMSEKYYKELLGRKYLGIQTDLGDRAPGRVGDGTIEWNVPMDQLKAVALSSDDRSFVLRFPSSYVYVKGQATVKATIAAGGNIALSFSDNNGLDYRPLATISQSGEQTIDLTDLVRRRYDYRLKFDLAGTGTKVDAIRAVHDFQCSQATLPVIAEGENKLTFSAGPQEGTITIEGATDPELAAKEGQVTIADFKPVLNGVDNRLRMTSGTGDATFDIATPGEMKRLRISVGWRARDAARDKWEVQTSYDGGKTFRTIETLEGGTPGNSRYVIDHDVPANTQAAKVRLAGRQGDTTLIFDLRIDADYVEPAGGFKPVKITYHWDEAAQPRQHVQVVRSENENYAITCGAGAVVKSFTMELAD